MPFSPKASVSEWTAPSCESGTQAAYILLVPARNDLPLISSPSDIGGTGEGGARELGLSGVTERYARIARRNAVRDI